MKDSRALAAVSADRWFSERVCRTVARTEDGDEVGYDRAVEEQAEQYAQTGVAATRKQMEAVDVMKLDDDRMEALRKIQQIEELVQKLPGMDCGSCGAPSCRALAEDIVRGHAQEMDCVFILKEKVRYLAEEMVDLASKDKISEDETE